MRLAEEQVEAYHEPSRIFPRRPLEWVLQIIGVFTIFTALLMLANQGVPPMHRLSLEENEKRGSVDPLDRKTNMLRRKRRLLSNLDFLIGNRKNQKIFLPKHPVSPHEDFYPYNISGSYNGSGRLSYTENEGSRDVSIASEIRIRTSLAGSHRYHAARMKILLNGMVDDGRHKTLNLSFFQQEFVLDALGIYDLETGTLQAIANSPTFPPKLPMFGQRRIGHPRLDWPASNKMSFHPTGCPFLVDASIDKISRDDFLKENGIRKQVNHHNHKTGMSSINVRKYINVHLKATVRSMNNTCTNITKAVVYGDLLRYDLFIMKSLKYAAFAVSLSLLHVLLVYRQMQFSTPANIAIKFSLISVAMHSVLDAYLSLLHLMTALYIDDLFYPFMMVFLLQFLVFSVFDLRFVLLVWRGRRPLDFSSGWGRVRSTLTKIYFGFYGGMLLSLLLLYYVRNRMSHVVFLLFAFWVPQIIHNIKTGDKFAIQNWFLFGVTCIRLFYPLYAYGCPHNFLEIPTDNKVVFGLLVFAGLQMLVLKAQDRWGSRFFIPKRLQPDYYDYHRTFQIDPDDYETCAICMIEIVSSTPDFTVDKEEVIKGNFEDFAMNVLTTPCNHRFCQECLVRWMETKMNCPTCRRALPPYNS